MATPHDIAFTLLEVAGLRSDVEAGRYGDLSADLVEAVLSAAAEFATGEIEPLAASGDRQGARLEDGEVRTPDGWPELYARWRDAGWNGLAAPAEHGGQGLPVALSAAVFEIWNSASMAFAIGPTLTVGAIEALLAHGSPMLKVRYLEKLVSGAWMGTMNLTEPQSGSDLSGLRTRAERQADGSYRIFGHKIFITYGEHDWTDNIVHLVLARLPDAPPGVKGISLFLVPKHLIEEDGSLGRRNDVVCASIEHKLGIHGSPTCTMIYGEGSAPGEAPGAVGWLIGEENRGLACMFTMMNNARLLVGVQGLGVAEAACRKAEAYASERRQGRATRLVGGGAGTDESPIAQHPDVAAMLTTMKALTGAARAIVYACGLAADRARAAQHPAEQRRWKARADLLTPVAKAFATDVGVEVASLGLQVHGGTGYIEETGAARLLRDARIAPIYEGTNGIQAIDLVTRKLGLFDGAVFDDYHEEMAAIVDALRASADGGFDEMAEPLTGALDDWRQATRFLQTCLAGGETDTALAGATAYLRLFGLTAGTAYLAKGALVDAPGRGHRQALARFAAVTLLAEASGLKRRILQGAAVLQAARLAVEEARP
ncbi:acyl-CoA dehydrogenase [Mangrovicella endophytica]|uniref:acyl-CoA dehydrogenase n=1 Tax=Mangrovicella endophytica TaxID=2066697 RepID=UPI000C9E2A60|nr:acyl-CoA dehydrogenase [Mangrovicella endophytica]